MATHVLERREQLRPVLKAAGDAEALKRGASLEEVSRLHDELARGAPVLERLIADGLAGRFPAEEVDIQNWKEMLKRAQDLQLKLCKRLNQRTARMPALAAERGQESSMEALREKREALRQRRIRTRDVATLAQIERELFEVEEQLVSKKIAERLPGWPPRAQPSLPWSGLRRRARSCERAPRCAEPAGQRHRLAVSELNPGQNRSGQKKEALVRPTEHFIIFP